MMRRCASVHLQCMLTCACCQELMRSRCVCAMAIRLRGTAEGSATWLSGTCLVNRDSVPGESHSHVVAKVEIAVLISGEEFTRFVYVFDNEERGKAALRST